MTKKHFIALADALRGTQPTIHPEGAGYRYQWQWEQDVQAVADFCQAQSSRFNRGRWLDYVNGLCGQDGGVK